MKISPNVWECKQKNRIPNKNLYKLHISNSLDTKTPVNNANLTQELRHPEPQSRALRGALWRGIQYIDSLRSNSKTKFRVATQQFCAGSHASMPRHAALDDGLLIYTTMPPRNDVSGRISLHQDRVVNRGQYRIIANGFVASALLLAFPEIIYASAFDVNAAGKAMFNPIITFIDAWYGTGIFAAGVGGAVVASGDLRTRALGFGIGSVISGLTLLGVKAGFGVKTVMHNFYNVA